MSEETFDEVRSVCILLCKQRGNSAAQGLLWDLGGYKLMDLPKVHWRRFTQAALLMLGDHAIGWSDALWQVDSEVFKPSERRAPLAYFTEQQERARFDPFRDFVVTSDCAYESQPNTCFAGLTLDGCGAFVLPKQAF